MMSKKDEKMKKKICKKSKLKILTINFTFILVIGVLYIVIYFISPYNEKRKIQGVINNAQIDKKLLTRVENDVNNTDVDNTESTRRMLEVRELNKRNEDIIGWIEIEGTNINYPVMQTIDNEYYMTHNFEKEYSKLGSIFLDKDCDWQKPSTNLLIYGHNNKNRSMFQNLMNYKTENYYKEHPNIRLTTLNKDAEYEIIAAFYSKVYKKEENNVFRYYYFINANNEAEFNYYIDECKKKSIYDTGKTARYGEQILTLSTCSYHTEDGRFALVAREKR